MKEERKLNNDLLRHSLDMHVLFQYAVVYLTVGAICAVVSFLRLDILELPERIGTSLLIPAIAVLPFGIFCAWRMFRIFRKSEAYVFGTAKLDTPVSGRIRGTMRFQVLMDAGEGRTICATTHSIFAAHGLFEPLVESYVNRTVTLAYNEETEVLVVLW